MGIEVAHSKEGMFISHQKYVVDLLKKIGLLDCKASDTPIDPNHKLGEALEENMVDKGVY